jgi:hypothetical protein
MGSGNWLNYRGVQGSHGRFPLHAGFSFISLSRDKGYAAGMSVQGSVSAYLNDAHASGRICIYSLARHRNKGTKFQVQLIYSNIQVSRTILPFSSFLLLSML